VCRTTVWTSVRTTRSGLFHLSQRLHTTKEASGTGVALATVRRLIVMHSGQVFAKRQLGESGFESRW
jgi:light-regulated signal transduction histidine kinase (bacteriophytochrome)